MWWPELTGTGLGTGMYLQGRTRLLLSCLLGPESFTMSQDRSVGLLAEDGGVGCLFLWVPEKAVCVIPILKCC